jgi:hypothetical protein
MIAVIRERSKDLRKRKMRQVLWNFFGRGAHPPRLNDGTNGRARPFDDRLSTQHIVATGNVFVLCGLCHEQDLLSDSTHL